LHAPTDEAWLDMCRKLGIKPDGEELT
jgi:hypothetical protein